MEIHVVKSDDKIEGCLFNRLMGFLSEDERQKINKYLRWEDAQRGLIGRVLIRSLITRTLSVKNQDIYFLENGFGKPFLKGNRAFHFNISHSGQWVVCAVDSRSIGIDVEEIKDIDLDIAKRFFSKREYNDLMAHNQNDRLEYFYDLWSLKESYIKAIGKGLSIPLDSFSIRKKVDTIALITDKENYAFKQYDIGENYKLSVCAKHNNFPEGINIINLKAFINCSIHALSI